MHEGLEGLTELEDPPSGIGGAWGPSGLAIIPLLYLQFPLL